jgi:hypothetical protein
LQGSVLAYDARVSRQCVGCLDSAIDAATRDSKRSNRAIAREFGVSEAAVRRHRANHLTRATPQREASGAERGGRPSKFTPDRVDRFLQAVRVGATLQSAALSVGWSEDGLARYRAGFADFADQIAEAEGAAQVHLVAIVRQAASSNWRAAMELLSRRWPEAWARHDRVDVDLRLQVKRLAAEYGLDEREILAEAERLVAGR